jgi:hypothetical protein
MDSAVAFCPYCECGAVHPMRVTPAHNGLIRSYSYDGENIEVRTDPQPERTVRECLFCGRSWEDGS